MPVGHQLEGGLPAFNSARGFVIEANIGDLGVRVQYHGLYVVLFCQFDNPVVHHEKWETDRTRTGGPTYQRPLGS
jgi:hypothetical protein